MEIANPHQGSRRASVGWCIFCGECKWRSRLIDFGDVRLLSRRSEKTTSGAEAAAFDNPGDTGEASASVEARQYLHAAGGTRNPLELDVATNCWRVLERKHAGPVGRDAYAHCQSSLPDRDQFQLPYELPTGRFNRVGTFRAIVTEVMAFASREQCPRLARG